MKTCKETGLVKFGSMKDAHDEIHASERRFFLQAEKCTHCKCVHVVPRKEEVVNTKRDPDPTRGTGNWVHMDVESIDNETDKAFLFSVDGEQKWFPKSVIADAEDYAKGDKDCTVSIQGWFMEKLTDL